MLTAQFCVSGPTREHNTSGTKMRVWLCSCTDTLFNTCIHLGLSFENYMYFWKSKTKIKRYGSEPSYMRMHNLDIYYHFEKSEKVVRPFFLVGYLGLGSAAAADGRAVRLAFLFLLFFAAPLLTLSPRYFPIVRLWLRTSGLPGLEYHCLRTSQSSPTLTTASPLAALDATMNQRHQLWSDKYNAVTSTNKLAGLIN